MKLIRLEGERDRAIVIDKMDYYRVAGHKWYFVKLNNLGHVFSMIEGEKVFLNQFIIGSSKVSFVSPNKADSVFLDYRRENLKEKLGFVVIGGTRQWIQ